jgi:TPR repeat protein
MNISICRFCLKSGDNSLNPRKISIGLINFLISLFVKNPLTSRRNQKKLKGYIHQRVVSQQLHGTFTGQHWRAECLLFEGKCLEMVQILENLIQKGHTPSMANLAKILIEGMDNIRPNHERMIQLLNLGISLNCYDCMGVKASINFKWILHDYAIPTFECYELAKKSALGMSKDGLYAFACALRQSYGHKETNAEFLEAFKYIEMAAEKGHPEALAIIGSGYEYGHYGYVKDEEAAFRCYNQAALRGEASSKVIVGQMYMNGKGVPCDINKAIYWFERAVAANYHNAQFFLDYARQQLQNKKRKIE